MYTDKLVVFHICLLRKSKKFEWVCVYIYICVRVCACVCAPVIAPCSCSTHWVTRPLQRRIILAIRFDAIDLLPQMQRQYETREPFEVIHQQTGFAF